MEATEAIEPPEQIADLHNFLAKPEPEAQASPTQSSPKNSPILICAASITLV